MINAQSSAAGLISLIHDPEPEIQSYAIEELNGVVALHWAEISESIADIEALSESTSPLPPHSRQLASLLSSKLYYHLSSLPEAVDAALASGPAFFSSSPSTSSGNDVVSKADKEYKETIIAACLDRAIEMSAVGEELGADLKGVVEGVLEGDVGDVASGRSGKLTIGLTLSLRRLDLLEKIYLQSTSSQSGSGKDEELLRYVLAETIGTGGGNEGWGVDFREELLHLLLRLFSLSTSSPDLTSISQIYLQLSSLPTASSLAADTLNSLLSQGKKLEAYQVGFDLADAGGQEFRRLVVDGLKGDEVEGLEELKEILGGGKSIRLNLEFLSKNNHADLQILKNTKDALEARHSIFHSAVTFMNSFANAGTTSDQFLRENLEWLGRASNWSMFSATAALGVIHQGSLTKAMDILRPYLPPEAGAQPNPHSSAYSEGGSLYALGLIHAGHAGEAKAYLKDKLKGMVEPDETIQHGAALGLGMSALASQDEELYEEVKNVLFQDSSVAGEAAGYAMGLIMLGSGSAKALDEMLQYAHETSHEKIIRGLAIGIALLMYGKGSEADESIEKLLADKDAILRYGGMYTIALAYAGTGTNQAIRKLLHVAVSDANDDVRRAAVTGLGFVLFRNYQQVPRVVQLLSESYNPHVRHGATLALGISCAGTGSMEAIELLEPMTKDAVDFVRQGAFVALAMILVQQTEAQNSKVASTRKLFEKTVSDKHEDSLAKIGAAISQGIIDAGGRNVTISLQTKAGTPNMKSIVGMTLFTQFWYWFPLAHALSLSFTPTAVIGLDVDLKIPKLEFTSNAKPSVFAYPPPWEAPKKETMEKVKTAVLSTTAKANARAKAKEQEKGGDAMDTDEKPEEVQEKQPEPEKKSEPSSETLSNLSRVTPAQLPYISFPSSGRYQPVRPITSATPRKGKKVGDKPYVGGGIIMLKDTKPDEASEFIELNPAFDRPPVAAAPADAMEVEEEEAPVPPAFEYPFGTEGA